MKTGTEQENAPMMHQFFDDDTFFEITEEEILKASKEAEEIGSNDYSQFSKALNIGHVYKMAGLTPMYLFDQLEKYIIVTTEEKQNNRLH